MIHWVVLKINDRENMQEDDPGMDEEVTEGIFSSSSNCEPKKKEEAKKKSGRGCKTGTSKGRSGSSKEKRSSSSKGRSSKRSIIHYNPFIVFYLETYWEHAGRKVTEIAKCAAKIWCKMSDSERAPYIKIAREESARRARMGIKIKRRKKCWFESVFTFLIQTFFNVFMYCS